MELYQVLSVLMVLTVCQAYSDGPPPSACRNMFPSGHGYSARMEEPPFTLSVSQTTYNPGDVITLTYNSSGPWFVEGMFVQARLANNCISDTAVGTFQLPTGEDFLQLFPCNGNADSAVRHFKHLKIYNRTFTWTAPSQAVGHIYFRGTLARNQSHFWTNVNSAFVRDASDNTTALPSRYCTSVVGSSTIVRPSFGLSVLLIIAALSIFQ